MMKCNIVVSVIFVLFVAGLASASDEPGKWMVSSGNVTCLIAQMNVKLNFTYQTSNNATNRTAYEIPIAATKVNDAESKCGPDTDVLSVTWSNGNNFTLMFKASNSSYNLTSFVVNINASDALKDGAVNQTITLAYKDSDHFNIPKNISYHCTREQTLNVTDGAEDKLILLSSVQFEAFKSDNSKVFSLAKDCDSNIKPDIVPIAVGISLIALIVIVLIAYIVGRRRQQARGYVNIM